MGYRFPDAHFLLGEEIRVGYFGAVTAVDGRDLARLQRTKFMNFPTKFWPSGVKLHSTSSS